MKISIEQDDNCKETEIIIKCKNIDENIEKLISILKLHDTKIVGTKDEKLYILNHKNIYYVESVDNKTFIYCEHEVYESSLKLYQIEEILNMYSFFRCSKSVVVNLKKIVSLTPLFNSKIEIELDNKEKLIVNRQYIKDLKAKLDID